MKKLISALIILALAVSFTAFTAMADEPAPSEENVQFTYDFSHVSDFKAEFGITQDNQIEYAPADGYTTFKATGEDPYFRIGTGAQGDDLYPEQYSSELTYMVMKYRTTAKIAMGEFFSNHGGQTWGMDGTHVEFKLKNDGEWHSVIIDAQATWGGAVCEPLYAFRVDPLYSGCKSGDTIDIEYIKFFSNYASAYEYATGEEYVEETTVSPDAKTSKIEYYVNDRLMYTVYYAPGQWTTDEEPAVPEIPGKNGMWAYNGTPQHGDAVLKAVAVYTDINPSSVTEPDPAVTEKYEIQTRQADVTTASETRSETVSSPDTAAENTESGGCSGIIGGALALLTLGFGLAAVKRRG